MTLDRKRRVLVVEDIEDISQSYKEILENAGYDVDIVETARTAVKALEGKLYDLALVDLTLKEEDITYKGGLEVLDAVKRLNEGTKTIVASATTEVKDSVASYRRGIDDFLMKNTTSSKEIVDTIGAVLKDHRPRFFGDFPTLTAYLAAPEVTPIWEHPIERALGCGYESMQKILWKALRPYVPILRRRDGAESLTTDPGRRAVGGLFWSKAAGCAIWFSARGEGGSFIEPPHDRPEHLADFDGRKVAAAVWRVDVPRDQFLESIRDEPGRT